jgi:hypothetical protein
MQDDDPDESLGGTEVLRLPPKDEIDEARAEIYRLRDDTEGLRANLNSWVSRWKAKRYHVTDQLISQLTQIVQQQQQQRQQQQQQEEQRRHQLGGEAPPKPVPPSEDIFSIEFSPEFTSEEAQSVAASLAKYFRACGGAGFEYDFSIQEATTTGKP